MNWNGIRKRVKGTAKQIIWHRMYLPLLAGLVLWLPGTLAAMALNSYILDLRGSPAAALLIYLAVLVFLCGPMLLSVTRYLQAPMTGTPLPLSAVFTTLSSVRQYVRALRLFLCIVLRSIPCVLIPAALLFSYAYLRLMTGPPTIPFITLYRIAVETSLLSLLLMIPAGGWILRYLGAYILAAEKPERLDKPWALIRESVTYTHGHSLHLILFFGSFVGWQLLGMFTLGVGTVFWMSYLWMAFTSYYDMLRKNYFARQAADHRSASADDAP